MTMALAAVVPGNALWIIVACLLLIGVVIAMAAIVFKVRRHWVAPADSAQATPWTLHGLRQMRDQGGMTEEEFESVRATMIAGIQGESDADGGTLGSSPPAGQRIDQETEWDWVAPASPPEAGTGGSSENR